MFYRYHIQQNPSKRPKLNPAKALPDAFEFQFNKQAKLTLPQAFAQVIGNNFGTSGDYQDS